MVALFFNMLIGAGVAGLVLIATVRIKVWGYQNGYWQLPTAVYNDSSDNDDDEILRTGLVNPETGMMMTEYGFDGGGNTYGQNNLDSSASDSGLFDDDSSTSCCSSFDDD